MSEGGAESADNLTIQSATPKITAGSLLRSAREREGLHIAALAVSMKVPVKKLEALEADRLDLLPDAVFVRALAASVCRTLKVDATPVLELLPASGPPRFNSDDRGINTPFTVPGHSNGTSLQSLLLTPPALIVLGLMIAAIVVYFYPVAARDSTVSDKFEAVVQAVAPDVTQETSAPATTLQSSPAPVAVTATTTPTTANPASSPAVLATVVLLPASNAITTPLPAPSAAQVVGGVSKSETSTPALNQANILQFRAKGTAWVQVSDAKGAQLLSRNLQAGEAVGVAGVLPLSVVVGRADLTDVELRGKPYDLTAITQNNVARFEVKQ